MRPTVPPEDRHEVEVLVPPLHLERDPEGGVAVEEDHLVPEHAVQQIDGCSVEDDDLDRHPQLELEQSLELEGQRVERDWRIDSVENAEVDVAAGSCRPPRQAAEEVRGDDCGIAICEQPLQLRCDQGLVHGAFSIRLEPVGGAPTA